MRILVLSGFSLRRRSRHKYNLFALAIIAVIASVSLQASLCRAQDAAARYYAPWLQTRTAVDDLESVRPQPAAAYRLRDSSMQTSRESALPVVPAPSAFSAEESVPAHLSRSALEQVYSQRIVDDLTQFGYDMFDEADSNHMNTSSFSLPAGAVQDDFLLSIGDQLTVTFRGQRNDQERYTIDNDGLLIIKDMDPISAAGRSISDIRAEIERHTEALHNTKAYVSLADIRQIHILVVGHVKKPGRQTLTVFHNVLDALMASGGIEKSGSLRQIKLVRNGRATLIDLYGLLVHGSDNMDLALHDGDRIIVPPVGPTVAIAGNVKRPGIYETVPAMHGSRTRPEQSSRMLSLEDALDLAGGLLSPGQNRFLKLGLTRDGQEKVEELSDMYAPAFGDGSILMVAPSNEKRSDMVELTGETRRPGLHALRETPTLSALLSDEKAFGPDIYPLIGVIERWDENQMAPRLMDFPPRLVLRKQFDRKLQDGDTVYLFSRRQILSLQEHQATTQGNIIAVGSREDFDDGSLLQDPVMTAFLNERAVFIRGAIHQPGAYPVAEGATLDTLLAVAGGLALEANTTNIEVTTKLRGNAPQADGSGTLRFHVNFNEQAPENIAIGPGDTVRVNQKFHKAEDQSVLLIGDVKHPGRYDLLPGDRMSDLLQRAGGLTQQAYPDGAVFSRESERRAEEARFHAQARSLELKLAAAMEQQNEKDGPSAGQIATVQELIEQLSRAEGVGRITIEADPHALASTPELDILLEAGDRIYIPQRPLTVRVSGEVLSPANLQFRSEKKPQDYIAEAGGFSYSADKNRSFVVYPDGSAQPLQVNVWTHNPVFVPPGSTIVVPRDPKPFDFIETARDVSQILSNLALTGIFIEDIRNN